MIDSTLRWPGRGAPRPSLADYVRGLTDAVMAFSAEDRPCERLDGGVQGGCSKSATATT